ncbi:COPI associated protein [Toxoplasma gondii VAND]|uniref:COPI associated protein n=1 Tax=Toxoplasma gondii VAND TaxID=933077 RepID=A0A086QEN2_TOXGO|nr:COPI associated protein [Toxoplasma gondii VAND]
MTSWLLQSSTHDEVVPVGSLLMRCRVSTALYAPVPNAHRDLLFCRRKEIKAVLDRCRSVRLSMAAMTFVSFITAGVIISSGIVGMIFFDPLRLAVNVILIMLGALSIIADVKALPLFAYVQFFYIPVGRGLFYVTIGLVILQKGLVDVILGISVIILGAVYAIVCGRSGGVPKPLMQRTIEELPLSAAVKFVDA